MLRRTLPTGQTLLVHGRMPDGHWHLELEDIKGAEIIGFPLNSALAELLGYQVAREEWPDWIDRLAEEIAAATATPRGSPRHARAGHFARARWQGFIRRTQYWSGSVVEEWSLGRALITIACVTATFLIARVMGIAVPVSGIIGGLVGVIALIALVPTQRD